MKISTSGDLLEVVYIIIHPFTGFFCQNTLCPLTPLFPFRVWKEALPPQKGQPGKTGPEGGSPGQCWVRISSHQPRLDITPLPYPWTTIAPSCTGVIGMGAVIDMLWNVNILMKNCLVIFLDKLLNFWQTPFLVVPICHILFYLIGVRFCRSCRFYSLTRELKKFSCKMLPPLGSQPRH